MQASYMLPVSVSSYGVSRVVSGRYCLLGVIHPLWLSHSFCLLPNSLHPEGRGLMEPSHSGLSVPRSLTLSKLLSCGSLC